MVWIVIPVAVLVIGGLIAFLFGPTIKTFFGPGLRAGAQGRRERRERHHDPDGRRRAVTLSSQAG